MTSCSVMAPPPVTPEGLGEMLAALKDGGCGQVFRAKGILKLASGGTVRFDFTPRHQGWEEWKGSEAEPAPRAVFIGHGLKEGKIRELFGAGPA